MNRWRPSSMVTCALAVLAVLTLAGCGAASTPDAPAPSTAAPATVDDGPPPPAVTVPLTLEGGAPRLVVHVTIGGADLRVVVDTGSSGLRVPAAKVPPGVATVRGAARPYAYASGLRLHGRLARVPASVGAASTPAMPIELVDSVDCTPNRPDCSAADGVTSDLMGGNFDGILGVSPQSGPDLGNPLWSLGAVGHRYALHVDPAGPSTLTLSAPADGYVLENLRGLRGGSAGSSATDPPDWQARIPVCVRAAFLPGGQTCLPTLFDTGTPPLANIHPPGAVAASAPPGSPVTVSTPDGKWSSTEVSERGRGANVPPPTTATNAGTTTLGLPAFESTDVRFDLAAGTIGLRQRA